MNQLLYAAARLEMVGRLCHASLMLNFCICESKRQLLFFANKIMHNFQTGFDFVKTFLDKTYILAVFDEKASKVILFYLKLKGSEII